MAVSEETRKRISELLKKDFIENPVSSITLTTSDGQIYKNISEKDTVQTTENIPEIPEGVEVSSSEGSQAPDAEVPQEINYEDDEK